MEAWSRGDREGVAEGFTKRHGCKMLVWYELGETMEAAITREKRLKTALEWIAEGKQRKGRAGQHKALAVDLPRRAAR